MGDESELEAAAIPKHLEQKISALAEESVSEHRKMLWPQDMWPPMEIAIFFAGAEALYQLLLEEAGEFDVTAALDYWINTPESDDTTADAINMARWQFDAMKAQMAVLKAEIESEKELREALTLSFGNKARARDELKAEVERLTDLNKRAAKELNLGIQEMSDLRGLAEDLSEATALMREMADAMETPVRYYNDTFNCEKSCDVDVNFHEPECHIHQDLCKALTKYRASRFAEEGEK